MTMGRLEFQILGPLAVRIDGAPVPVGGPKQRALLALLLLSANRVVSRERLSAELFPAEDVAARDHALRNHVSRLRKVLGGVAADEPRLVARPPGYLLRVEPGELDLDTFESLVAQGRRSLASGDAASAAESLHAAEALWTGRPLSDLDFEPFTRVEVERLEEVRLAAVEARIEADLALGRQLELVPELELLAEEHPFRERFRAQLMLALYRSGRQAEGLEAYRRTRALMIDELGLEPGAELQQLERAMLAQDAALGVTADGNERAAPDVSDVCPFKGLAPFEIADAEFFFGRERLVEELVARLADAPLLAIVGPSGSGKSSLLRAGLVPALGYESVVIRPGERPTAGLADAVSPGKDGRVVLAVDQFEELFAVAVPEHERRAFVDSLVETAWDAERRVLIVIALRADFFGRLAAYVELADLVGPNHVLLGPMSQAELRRAIQGPAERAGLEIEPALVDRLVDEVAGESGGLPLLSTALVDLWREREGGSLTLAAYQRTGGVHGAVGRYAEAAFRFLSEEEQETARRILLRLAAGGGGEPLTRRCVSRRELDADEDERVAAVLEALVERRLLVADDGTVELVHEALLERWRRLVDWLEEDVQGRLLHRHLTVAAGEWEASGRDPGALYRGARLTGALEWTGQHAPDLNQLEREFLEESEAASVRETARQRRANRRLRGLLIAAVALLVLSGLAALFALEKRGQAQRAATAADAERLGAQALVDPNLDQALLLAREGVNLADSETTRSNLLAALLRSPAAIGVVHTGSDRLLDEALSPDGRTLAVRGDNGNVTFFDTRTLRPTRLPLQGINEVGLFGAEAPLHALAFSPDGRAFAVGSTTGGGPRPSPTVELVRRRSLAPITSSAPGNITADVAFSPDGRTFATGEVNILGSSPAEVIVVRNARTGRERAQSRLILLGRLAGFTRDGRFLLAASGQHRSVLLDARSLKPQRTFPVGGAAAVSPAAEEAAFGHPDGSVTLLHLDTGRSTILAGRATGPIDAVSFSRDGRLIATPAEDGSVSIWSVPSGALRETLTGHSAAVREAVFGPDGQTLYTVGDDGSAIVWDVGGARRLAQVFRYTPSTGHASGGSAVSPNGSLFAVSPGPDRVALWRAANHSAAGPPLHGPVGHVYAIAFSGDGKLLAASGSRHAVLWDTATRKIVRILPVGQYGAPALAFGPGSLTLAIGGNDMTDTLFDLRTGRQVAALVGNGSISDVDFSPDGKLLASASLSGSDTTVWDVSKQSAVAALPTSVAAFSVRFSPNGKLVAVGDSSGTVELWKLDRSRRFSVPGQTAIAARRTGQPLPAHGGGVVSIAFDPSGRMLVTLSVDGSLRLWDVATRKLIGAPLPGSSAGGSVHFFPDGKHVLATFANGTAVVWNVDPAAWKTRACSVAGRNLTRAEWAQFLGRRTYRRVCP